MDELRNWIALTIAIVALIQPAAIWAWATYWRRGTIDIHETFTIETGFSSYGPTIGMNGTLRAIHHDLFIRSIDLVVTKMKDSSRYVFEWLVFRPASVTYGGVQQETSVELPAGFLLTTAQPRRYNITFFDRARQSEIAPHLQNLSAAWQERLTSLNLPDSALLRQQNVDWGAVVKTVYQAFTNDDLTNVATYSAVDRLFYWDAGRYSLEMRVNTTRPNRTFSRRWTFSLSEADAASIRQNVVRTLMTTCGQWTTAFNFAYAEYEET